MFKKLLILLIVILILAAVVILGKLGAILPWPVARSDQTPPMVVETGPTQAAISTVPTLTVSDRRVSLFLLFPKPQFPGCRIKRPYALLRLIFTRLPSCQAATASWSGEWEGANL